MRGPLISFFLILCLVLLGCGPQGQSPQPKTGGTAAGQSQAPAEPAEATGEPADEASTEEDGEGGTAIEQALRDQIEAQQPDAAGSGEVPVASSREEVDPANKVGIMETSKGTIYFFFYPDDAPLHVKNFIYLAQRDFFREVPFHRIVPGFVIQGGEARLDWTEPLPAIKNEANRKRSHLAGALSAARIEDPHSATSQFYFVIKRESAAHLDGGYTVYGQAFRGMEVIEAIGASEQNQGVDKIISVSIVDATPYAEEIAKFKADRGLPE